SKTNKKAVMEQLEMILKYGSGIEE
ncbi:MAG: YihA family ribosome biogenesis GTP-binding protein, partial [Finegoldia magna]|nr:YihA family ribosome biogenesis GTP-binding protein [Finegoldia magna]